MLNSRATWRGRQPGRDRQPRGDERRKADHPRDPDLHKKSRRRLYPQLPRQRGVSVAEGRGVSALSL